MTVERILIIGGYGRFGGFVAQLLARRASTTLLIAGRSPEKAQAFCVKLAAEMSDPVRASLRPTAFDRDGDVFAQLQAAAPDLVIDASGPFQIYGREPYRVVKACLALGLNYLDLADGTDFVAGIDAFDTEAQARGVFILSGVSSMPALSAAAVETMVADLAQIDAIWSGIAPSAFAGLGLNVVQAIASYAGKKIRIWRRGRLDQAYGLLEGRWATVAPPGCLPLTSRRFLLVDAPDLRVLQHRWPGLSEVWTGAGPEYLQLPLLLAAWLVRLRILPRLTPFAGIMHQVLNRLRRGEHRSGMIVAVTGRTIAAEQVSRSWHLLAEGEDGPVIPAMASAAIVQLCDQGRVPLPGARPAIGDLHLSDFDPFFADRAIQHGWREEKGPEKSQGEPLYRRLLGSAWDKLPAEIRQVHDLAGELTLTGRAQIDRGGFWLARLIAWLFGFPAAGSGVPVSVSLMPLPPAKDQMPIERWQRNFAGRRFISHQRLGTGRRDYLIVERFGPVSVDLAVTVANDRLSLVPRRVSILGCPLPRAWTPIGTSYEAVVDGRFNFHVEIAHPLTGLIVRYRGWLVPQTGMNGGATEEAARVAVD